MPNPRIRDTLLRAGNSYDDLELCADLVGFSPTTRTGLIVWREPLGGGLRSCLRWWGWTIRECKELVRSPNYWRSQRGENPLEFGEAWVGEVVDEVVDDCSDISGAKFWYLTRIHECEMGPRCLSN